MDPAPGHRCESLIPGVVVDVRRVNMALQDFKGLGHVAHDVGVAKIETYADVVEVA